MIPQVHLQIEDKEDLLADFETIVTTGWLSEGQFTKKYMDLACSRLMLRNLLPVPNGTLGLLLAMLAAKSRWDVGDILIPTFTFYGSVTPVLPLGFKPVFVDCSKETFQCELENYREAETSNTVGVMLVHIYGQIGSEAEAIANWAREKGYFVIEDAAQAVGASNESGTAGSFGDITVFSTYSDKALPTGEGGLISAKDDDLFDAIKLIRNQGRPNSGTFSHPSFGMNFRITDMQAAIGAHLLTRYDNELERRRSIYEIYRQVSLKLNIQTMEVEFPSGLVPFRFPVLAKTPSQAKNKLEEKGFQTRGFFLPMHCQPLFKDKSKSLPNAEYLHDHGLCLPVHTLISNYEVTEQLKCIK